MAKQIILTTTGLALIISLAFFANPAIAADKKKSASTDEQIRKNARRRGTPASSL